MSIGGARRRLGRYRGHQSHRAEEPPTSPGLQNSKGVPCRPDAGSVLGAGRGPEDTVPALVPWGAQSPAFLLLIIALLRNNSLSRKSILLKCTVQWFLYIHEVRQPSPLIPEYFYHPSKRSISRSFPFPTPCSQPLATMNLLSVSMNLPILGIL